MDTLECLHNFLTAGIFVLFCVICVLVNKCCMLSGGGDGNSNCTCRHDEFVGEITPSNNFLIKEPGKPPRKLPLYEFLQGNAGEPSASCEKCCGITHANQLSQTQRRTCDDTGTNTDIVGQKRSKRRVGHEDDDTSRPTTTDESEDVEHIIRVKVKLSDSAAEGAKKTLVHETPSGTRIAVTGPIRFDTSSYEEGCDDECTGIERPSRSNRSPYADNQQTKISERKSPTNRQDKNALSPSCDPECSGISKDDRSHDKKDPRYQEADIPYCCLHDSQKQSDSTKVPKRAHWPDKKSSSDSEECSCDPDCRGYISTRISPDVSRKTIPDERKGINDKKENMDRDADLPDCCIPDCCIPDSQKGSATDPTILSRNARGYDKNIKSFSCSPDCKGIIKKVKSSLCSPDCRGIKQTLSTETISDDRPYDRTAKIDRPYYSDTFPRSGGTDIPDCCIPDCCKTESQKESATDSNIPPRKPRSKERTSPTDRHYVKNNKSSSCSPSCRGINQTISSESDVDTSYCCFPDLDKESTIIDPTVIRRGPPKTVGFDKKLPTDNDKNDTSSRPDGKGKKQGAPFFEKDTTRRLYDKLRSDSNSLASETSRPGNKGKKSNDSVLMYDKNTGQYKVFDKDSIIIPPDEPESCADICDKMDVPICVPISNDFLPSEDNIPRDKSDLPRKRGRRPVSAGDKSGPSNRRCPKECIYAASSDIIPNKKIKHGPDTGVVKSYDKPDDQNFEEDHTLDPSYRRSKRAHPRDDESLSDVSQQDPPPRKKPYYNENEDIENEYEKRFGTKKPRTIPCKKECYKDSKPRHRIINEDYPQYPPSKAASSSHDKIVPDDDINVGMKVIFPPVAEDGSSKRVEEDSSDRPDSPTTTASDTQDGGGRPGRQRDTDDESDTSPLKSTKPDTVQEDGKSKHEKQVPTHKKTDNERPTSDVKPITSVSSKQPESHDSKEHSKEPLPTHISDDKVKKPEDKKPKSPSDDKKAEPPSNVKPKPPYKKEDSKELPAVSDEKVKKPENTKAKSPSDDKKAKSPPKVEPKPQDKKTDSEKPIAPKVSDDKVKKPKDITARSPSDDKKVKFPPYIEPKAHDTNAGSEKPTQSQTAQKDDNNGKKPDSVPSDKMSSSSISTDHPYLSSKSGSENTISDGKSFPSEEVFTTDIQPKKRDDSITKLYMKYGSPEDISRITTEKSTSYYSGIGEEEAIPECCLSSPNTVEKSTSYYNETSDTDEEAEMPECCLPSTAEKSTSYYSDTSGTGGEASIPECCLPSPNTVEKSTSYYSDTCATGEEAEMPECCQPPTVEKSTSYYNDTSGTGEETEMPECCSPPTAEKSTSYCSGEETILPGYCLPCPNTSDKSTSCHSGTSGAEIPECCLSFPNTAEKTTSCGSDIPCTGEGIILPIYRLPCPNTAEKSTSCHSGTSRATIPECCLPSTAEKSTSCWSEGIVLPVYRLPCPNIAEKSTSCHSGTSRATIPECCLPSTAEKSTSCWSEGIVLSVYRLPCPNTVEKSTSCHSGTSGAKIPECCLPPTAEKSSSCCSDISCTAEGIVLPDYRLPCPNTCEKSTSYNSGTDEATAIPECCLPTEKDKKEGSSSIHVPREADFPECCILHPYDKGTSNVSTPSGTTYLIDDDSALSNKMTDTISKTSDISDKKMKQPDRKYKYYSNFDLVYGESAPVNNENADKDVQTTPSETPLLINQPRDANDKYFSDDDSFHTGASDLPPKLIVDTTGKESSDRKGKSSSKPCVCVDRHPPGHKKSTSNKSSPSDTIADIADKKSDQLKPRDRKSKPEEESISQKEKPGSPEIKTDNKSDSKVTKKKSIKDCKCTKKLKPGEIPSAEETKDSKNEPKPCVCEDRHPPRHKKSTPDKLISSDRIDDIADKKSDKPESRDSKATSEEQLASTISDKKIKKSRDRKAKFKIEPDRRDTQTDSDELLTPKTSDKNIQKLRGRKSKSLPEVREAKSSSDDESEPDSDELFTRAMSEKRIKKSTEIKSKSLFNVRGAKSSSDVESEPDSEDSFTRATSEKRIKKPREIKSKSLFNVRGAKSSSDVESEPDSEDSLTRAISEKPRERKSKSLSDARGVKSSSDVDNLQAGGSGQSNKMADIDNRSHKSKSSIADSEVDSDSPKKPDDKNDISDTREKDQKYCKCRKKWKLRESPPAEETDDSKNELKPCDCEDRHPPKRKKTTGDKLQQSESPERSINPEETLTPNASDKKIKQHRAKSLSDEEKVKSSSDIKSEFPAKEKDSEKPLTPDVSDKNVRKSRDTAKSLSADKEDKSSSDAEPELHDRESKSLTPDMSDNKIKKSKDTKEKSLSDDLEAKSSSDVKPKLHDIEAKSLTSNISDNIINKPRDSKVKSLSDDKEDKSSEVEPELRDREADAKQDSDSKKEAESHDIETDVKPDSIVTKKKANIQDCKCRKKWKPGESPPPEETDDSKHEPKPCVCEDRHPPGHKKSTPDKVPPPESQERNVKNEKTITPDSSDKIIKTPGDIKAKSLSDDIKVKSFSDIEPEFLGTETDSEKPLTPDLSDKNVTKSRESKTKSLSDDKEDISSDVEPELRDREANSLIPDISDNKIKKPRDSETKSLFDDKEIKSLSEVEPELPDREVDDKHVSDSKKEPESHDIESDVKPDSFITKKTDTQYCKCTKKLKPGESPPAEETDDSKNEPKPCDCTDRHPPGHKKSSSKSRKRNVSPEETLTPNASDKKIKTPRDIKAKSLSDAKVIKSSPDIESESGGRGTDSEKSLTSDVSDKNIRKSRDRKTKSLSDVKEDKSSSDIEPESLSRGTDSEKSLTPDVSDKNIRKSRDRKTKSLSAVKGDKSSSDIEPELRDVEANSLPPDISETKIMKPRDAKAKSRSDDKEAKSSSEVESEVSDRESDSKPDSDSEKEPKSRDIKTDVRPDNYVTKKKDEKGCKCRKKSKPGESSPVEESDDSKNEPKPCVCEDRHPPRHKKKTPDKFISSDTTTTISSMNSENSEKSLTPDVSDKKIKKPKVRKSKSLSDNKEVKFSSDIEFHGRETDPKIPLTSDITDKKIIKSRDSKTKSLSDDKEDKSSDVEPKLRDKKSNLLTPDISDNKLKKPRNTKSKSISDDKENKSSSSVEPELHDIETNSLPPDSSDNKIMKPPKQKKTTPKGHKIKEPRNSKAKSFSNDKDTRSSSDVYSDADSLTPDISDHKIMKPPRQKKMTPKGNKNKKPRDTKAKSFSIDKDTRSSSDVYTDENSLTPDISDNKIMKPPRQKKTTLKGNKIKKSRDPKAKSFSDDKKAISSSDDTDANSLTPDISDNKIKKPRHIKSKSSSEVEPELSKSDDNKNDMKPCVCKDQLPPRNKKSVEFDPNIIDRNKSTDSTVDGGKPRARRDTDDSNTSSLKSIKTRTAQEDDISEKYPEHDTDEPTHMKDDAIIRLYKKYGSPSDNELFTSDNSVPSDEGPSTYESAAQQLPSSKKSTPNKIVPLDTVDNQSDQPESLKSRQSPTSQEDDISRKHSEHETEVLIHDKDDAITRLYKKYGSSDDDHSAEKPADSKKENKPCVCEPICPKHKKSTTDKSTESIAKEVNKNRSIDSHTQDSGKKQPDYQQSTDDDRVTQPGTTQEDDISGKYPEKETQGPSQKADAITRLYEKYGSPLDNDHPTFDNSVSLDQVSSTSVSANQQPSNEQFSSDISDKKRPLKPILRVKQPLVTEEATASKNELKQGISEDQQPPRQSGSTNQLFRSDSLSNVTIIKSDELKSILQARQSLLPGETVESKNELQNYVSEDQQPTRQSGSTNKLVRSDSLSNVTVMKSDELKSILRARQSLLPDETVESKNELQNYVSEDQQPTRQSGSTNKLVRSDSLSNVTVMKSDELKSILRARQSLLPGETAESKNELQNYVTENQQPTRQSGSTNKLVRSDSLSNVTIMKSNELEPWVRKNSEEDSDSQKETGSYDNKSYEKPASFDAIKKDKKYSKSKKIKPGESSSAEETDNKSMDTSSNEIDETSSPAFLHKRKINFKLPADEAYLPTQRGTSVELSTHDDNQQKTNEESDKKTTKLYPSGEAELEPSKSPRDDSITRPYYTSIGPYISDLSSSENELDDENKHDNDRKTADTNLYLDDDIKIEGLPACCQKELSPLQVSETFFDDDISHESKVQSEEDSIPLDELSTVGLNKYNKTDEDDEKSKSNHEEKYPHDKHKKKRTRSPRDKISVAVDPYDNSQSCSEESSPSSKGSQHYVQPCCHKKSLSRPKEKNYKSTSQEKPKGHNYPQEESMPLNDLSDSNLQDKQMIHEEPIPPPIYIPLLGSPTDKKVDDEGSLPSGSRAKNEQPFSDQSTLQQGPIVPVHTYDKEAQPYSEASVPSNKRSYSNPCCKKHSEDKTLNDVESLPFESVSDLQGKPESEVTYEEPIPLHVATSLSLDTSTDKVEEDAFPQNEESQIKISESYSESIPSDALSNIGLKRWQLSNQSDKIKDEGNISPESIAEDVPSRPENENKSTQPYTEIVILAPLRSRKPKDKIEDDKHPSDDSDILPTSTEEVDAPPPGDEDTGTQPYSEVTNLAPLRSRTPKDKIEDDEHPSDDTDISPESTEAVVPLPPEDEDKGTQPYCEVTVLAPWRKRKPEDMIQDDESPLDETDVSPETSTKIILLPPDKDKRGSQPYTEIIILGPSKSKMSQTQTDDEHPEISTEKALQPQKDASTQSYTQIIIHTPSRSKKLQSQKQDEQPSNETDVVPEAVNVDINIRIYSTESIPPLDELSDSGCNAEIPICPQRLDDGTEPYVEIINLSPWRRKVPEIGETEDDQPSDETDISPKSVNVLVDVKIYSTESIPLDEEHNSDGNTEFPICPQKTDDGTKPYVFSPLQDNKTEDGHSSDEGDISTKNSAQWSSDESIHTEDIIDYIPDTNLPEQPDKKDDNSQPYSEVTNLAPLRRRKPADSDSEPEKALPVFPSCCKIKSFNEQPDKKDDDTQPYSEVTNLAPLRRRKPADSDSEPEKAPSVFPSCCKIKSFNDPISSNEPSDSDNKKPINDSSCVCAPSCAPTSCTNDHMSKVKGSTPDSEKSFPSDDLSDSGYSKSHPKYNEPQPGLAKKHPRRPQDYIAEGSVPSDETLESDLAAGYPAKDSKYYKQSCCQKKHSRRPSDKTSRVSFSDSVSSDEPSSRRPKDKTAEGTYPQQQFSKDTVTSSETLDSDHVTGYPTKESQYFKQPCCQKKHPPRPKDKTKKGTNSRVSFCKDSMSSDGTSVSIPSKKPPRQPKPGLVCSCHARRLQDRTTSKSDSKGSVPSNKSRKGESKDDKIDSIPSKKQPRQPKAGIVCSCHARRLEDRITNKSDSKGSVPSDKSSKEESKDDITDSIPSKRQPRQPKPGLVCSCHARRLLEISTKRSDSEGSIPSDKPSKEGSKDNITDSIPSKRPPRKPKVGLVCSCHARRLQERSTKRSDSEGSVPSDKPSKEETKDDITDSIPSKRPPRQPKPGLVCSCHARRLQDRTTRKSDSKGSVPSNKPSKDVSKDNKIDSIPSKKQPRQPKAGIVCSCHARRLEDRITNKSDSKGSVPSDKSSKEESKDDITDSIPSKRQPRQPKPGLVCSCHARRLLEISTKRSDSEGSIPSDKPSKEGSKDNITDSIPSKRPPRKPKVGLVCSCHARRLQEKSTKRSDSEGSVPSDKPSKEKSKDEIIDSISSKRPLHEPKKHVCKCPKNHPCRTRNKSLYPYDKKELKKRPHAPQGRPSEGVNVYDEEARFISSDKSASSNEEPHKKKRKIDVQRPRGQKVQLYPQGNESEPSTSRPRDDSTSRPYYTCICPYVYELISSEEDTETISEPLPLPSEKIVCTPCRRPDLPCYQSLEDYERELTAFRRQFEEDESYKKLKIARAAMLAGISNKVQSCLSCARALTKEMNTTKLKMNNYIKCKTCAQASRDKTNQTDYVKWKQCYKEKYQIPAHESENQLAADHEQTEPVQKIRKFRIRIQNTSPDDSYKTYKVSSNVTFTSNAKPSIQNITDQEASPIIETSASTNANEIPLNDRLSEPGTSRRESSGENITDQEKQSVIRICTRSNKPHDSECTCKSSSKLSTTSGRELSSADITKEHLKSRIKIRTRSSSETRSSKVSVEEPRIKTTRENINDQEQKPINRIRSRSCPNDEQRTYKVSSKITLTARGGTEITNLTDSEKMPGNPLLKIRINREETSAQPSNKKQISADPTPPSTKSTVRLWVEDSTTKMPCESTREYLERLRKDNVIPYSSSTVNDTSSSHSSTSITEKESSDVSEVLEKYQKSLEEANRTRRICHRMAAWRQNNKTARNVMKYFSDGPATSGRPDYGQFYPYRSQLPRCPCYQPYAQPINTASFPSNRPCNCCVCPPRQQYCIPIPLPVPCPCHPDFNSIIPLYKPAVNINKPSVKSIYVRDRTKNKCCPPCHSYYIQRPCCDPRDIPSTSRAPDPVPENMEDFDEN